MTKAPKPAKRDIIRTLNDHFRTTLLGGNIVMSQEMSVLPKRIQLEILTKVQAFNDFSPENDPHREHDFGSFSFDDETVFFKIDYYAKDLESGSPNPADEKLTTRVLTIFFASEY